MAVIFLVVDFVVITTRTEARRNCQNLGGGGGKRSFDEEVAREVAGDQAAGHCELGTPDPVVLALSHVGVLWEVNAEVVYNYSRSKTKVKLDCGSYLLSEYY
jgi:hypothetical protein